MAFQDDIFEVSPNATYFLADVGEIRACEVFTKRLYIADANADLNAPGCQPVRHSFRVKFKRSNSDNERLQFNDAHLQRRVLIAYV